MKLEQQVATFEQSKKLKELGVEIDSYFWWCDYGKKGSTDYIIESKLPEICRQNIGTYPAPTAEEIAELLPGQIKIEGNLYEYCQEKVCKRYDMSYVCIEDNLEHLNIIKHADTLTQALASMLIWLIENKHINPKELNGK